MGWRWGEWEGRLRRWGGGDGGGRGGSAPDPTEPGGVRVDGWEKGRRDPRWGRMRDVNDGGLVAAAAVVVVVVVKRRSSEGGGGRGAGGGTVTKEMWGEGGIIKYEGHMV